MPCFGTTKRTKSNAEKLAEAYNVSFEEINITAAVRQHFIDIKHDESVTDITYENSQARERTKILMNLSNKYGGLVIGTGDLSELALGWATYNGDHMSMYAVNVSIPKTLVRYLTAYEAEISDGELKTVLLDVLDTPVSPELLPPDKNGEIAQKPKMWSALMNCMTFSFITLCVLDLLRQKYIILQSIHLRESTITIQ